MGNKQNRIKRSKYRQRKKRRQFLQNVAQQRRQKNILRKLNPPPEPEPEDEPESEVERAPSPSQSIEVTGPRSCRLKKCAFSGCPNSAPSPAQHNDGIAYFPFPRNPKQHSTWARQVSRANRDQFWPLLTSRVCARHFPPELISSGHGGVAALARGAVPSAEPYRNVTSDIIFEVINKGEIPNIEEVGDINEQVESLNYSEDLVINLDIDDKNPEVEQAVATLVDIPQCVNVENKNATVHYLSVDKDNTVNHTHVSINKNNIATLHYVDNKNNLNHTLKCSNLNEDQITSYEALVNPNITQTRVMSLEIVPNQNDQENDFGIKSNSKLVCGKNMTPDEEIDETIQNTESDNLDTDITVTSEDCNSGGETEETVIGEADTSAGIQTCDDNFDENVVVVLDSDSE